MDSQLACGLWYGKHMRETSTGIRVVNTLLFAVVVLGWWLLMSTSGSPFPSPSLANSGYWLILSAVSVGLAVGLAKLRT